MIRNAARCTTTALLLLRIHGWPANAPGPVGTRGILPGEQAARVVDGSSRSAASTFSPLRAMRALPPRRTSSV